MLIKILKVKGYEDIPLPKYMSMGAVGMDLYAAVDENIILSPGKRAVISTGICVEISKGFEAQIRPRSGLAAKYGITLLNTPGTIDWDYRGEIKVIMINLGDEDFIISRGDRIAQMVINKIEVALVEEVEVLEVTSRGQGGFGSTGYK